MNKLVVLFLAVLISPLSLSYAKDKKVPKRNQQYKKQLRKILLLQTTGKIDKSLEEVNRFLKKYPNDHEHLFLKTIGLTKKGKLKDALEQVRQAVKAGLPFERFLAGPRNMLAPLYETKGFKALVMKYGKALIHGPMVGSVTHDRARFWIRTATDVPFGVELSTTTNFATLVASTKGKTQKSSDYTGVVEVTGLSPMTRYHYRLTIDGKTVSTATPLSFKTYPKKGRPVKCTFAFGGGAGYTPKHERMWSTIASHSPDSLLLLGDNVYIDTPNTMENHHYCYYRRQSRPEFRALVATTPVYAIYDDHDFGFNDCKSTLDVNVPAWKLPVLKTFTENWVNPSYGGGVTNPGCYFKLSYGDVDVFFLDTRFYRQDPKKVKRPSMLGPVQKAWLLKKLKESKATFKLIASSVPMASGTKPGSKDTWDGHPEERQEIFSLIDAHKINGVILLSADRHRSDAWKLKRPNGYTLYEFMSSRLTNVHTHPTIKNAMFGYNKKCSFGLLEIDTTQKDPTFVYKIITIDNEVVHAFALKLSQLTFNK